MTMKRMGDAFTVRNVAFIMRLPCMLNVLLSLFSDILCSFAIQLYNIFLHSRAKQGKKQAIKASAYAF